MSVTISAVVSDELAERIDNKREGEGDNRESRSTVIERLLRTALDDGEQSPHAVSLPIILMWFGTVAVSAQYASASGAIGPAGLVALILGFILTRKSVTSRLEALHGTLSTPEKTAD